jgi:hypothetical protein
MSNRLLPDAWLSVRAMSAISNVQSPILVAGSPVILFWSRNSAPQRWQSTNQVLSGSKCLINANVSLSPPSKGSPYSRFPTPPFLCEQPVWRIFLRRSSSVIAFIAASNRSRFSCFFRFLVCACSSRSSNSNCFRATSSRFDSALS